HDSRPDDRRGRPRRPLDPRPHEHHPGARGARHRARRGPGAPACAGACRSRGQARRLSGLIFTEETMAEAAALKTPDADTEEMTDGFNLIIDAMKLNGIETIYGVPGIPITDFGRMAQAAG